MKDNISKSDYVKVIHKINYRNNLSRSLSIRDIENSRTIVQWFVSSHTSAPDKKLSMIKKITLIMAHN